MTAVTSPPDLVFMGGAVFVPDRAAPATAVAVHKGRIVAVGDAEVADLAGVATKVVDLAGGLLVPGFIDAHIHPVQGGLERMRCDLSELETKDAYRQAVREYAEANPETPWITGGGWSMTAFAGGTPRASDIDDVVADRPVFLPNRDHHGAWVNSRALALAGIDRHTPDPADGRIELDAAGDPTGSLHEGAMALVGRLVPADTAADRLAALLEAQRHLHGVGITGWQDAIVGRYANIDDSTDAYLGAADAGLLSARVVGALWWERDQGLEQLPRLAEQRATASRDRFRPTSVKIMQDGVVENGTAGMLAHYLDASGVPTDNRGLSFVDPQQLPTYVAALDEAGFQVHVHAIGDAAVRAALDAFAHARGVHGDRDRRHHIAHLQVIHPDDVPRFGALGVAANMQPLWAVYDDQMTELTLPFLGPERSAQQYPFASLAAGGAVLAGGSDWPVSSPDPLLGIHAAVNRALPGESAHPFLPDQALDVTTAVRAYTAGSAYLCHLDDAGQIDVGNLADLVVLDRDILAGPPQEIADAHVMATYVGGVQVH